MSATTQPQETRPDFAVVGSGSIWDGIAYWACSSSGCS